MKVTKNVYFPRTRRQTTFKVNFATISFPAKNKVCEEMSSDLPHWK